MDKLFADADQDTDKINAVGNCAQKIASLDSFTIIVRVLKTFSRFDLLIRHFSLNCPFTVEVDLFQFRYMVTLKMAA